MVLVRTFEKLVRTVENGGGRALCERVGGGP
jgi:hypothetical protein